MKREKIIQLETSLDHLDGEETGHALCIINDMPQVLDALYLTGIGKKNRPAGLLQVICRPGDEEAVCRAIFRHTHTLGIRIREVERVILPRREASVSLAGEKVRAKEYEIEGETYIRPEADDLARLAEKLDLGSPALRSSRKR